MENTPAWKRPAIDDSLALREAAMEEALRLAVEAAAAGEVPVGAVVTCDGAIVGRGRNRREGAKNALSHAEMEAMDEACRTLGGWRLHRCTLYVTLEPCPMCAGAAVNARMKKVIYGAADPKGGAFGSLLDLNDFPLNHHPTVEKGFRADDCAEVLEEFFARLREKRQREK